MVSEGTLRRLRRARGVIGVPGGAVGPSLGQSPAFLTTPLSTVHSSLLAAGFLPQALGEQVLGQHNILPALDHQGRAPGRVPESRGC